MSQGNKETILIAILVEHDQSGAEIILSVGGRLVATGITAPDARTAIKLLVDRLAGIAP